MGTVSIAQGVSAVIPTVSTGTLTTTTTNDNAAAGGIGEYVVANISSAGAQSLTSGTTANVTSISLTAGDWDVTGLVAYTAGATTVLSNLRQGISTTSATLGATSTFTSEAMNITGPTIDPSVDTPIVRISIASTTTVYLVTNGTFTTSTLKAYGSIRARRVR